MHLSKRVQFSIIIALLFSGLMATRDGKTQDTEELSIAVFEAEARGHLVDALEILGEKDLPAPYAGHGEMLRNAVEAIKVAAIYRQSNMNEQAVELLNSLVQELDSIRDVYLLIAVRNELDEIELEFIESIRKRANDLLDIGFAQIEAKKYDQAMETFDEVIEISTEKGRILEGVRRKALEGKTKAAKEQAAASEFLNEIIGTVIKAFRSIAEIIIYVLIAVFLFLFFSWIRRTIRRRPGTLLSIEDHTADPEGRELRDRELTSELAQEIRSIAGCEVGGRQREAMIELEGTDLVSVETTLGGVAEIGTQIDETPVRVGPLYITPRQIFYYLLLLFRPQYEYTLAGVLMKSGNRTVLWVEKRKRDGTPVEGCRYESVCEGEEARFRVVRDVAAQVALSFAGFAVTKDWESLRSYLNAEELLARDEISVDRREVLEKALDQLQTSLRHDPANWMARFKIATVLRKVGDYEAAADQFKYIYERMRKSRESHFQNFLGKRPEFLWVVQYNHAISLSKLGSERSTKKARNILEELISEIEKGIETAEQDRKQYDRMWLLKRERADLTAILAEGRRMLMLARSSRAAACSVELEHLRNRAKFEEKASEGLRKSIDQVFELIIEDEQWLWNMLGKVERGDWQAYATSHAVAQNACGRAYYLMGNYNEAYKYFKWAINLHMPLNFADAYVNVASVYRKEKERRSPDWAARAEAYLKQALDINPDHQKAHHIIGRVYSSHDVARYDEAKKHFRQAGGHPWSLFHLAKILIEQDKELEEGFNLLRRSLAIDPRPDYRYYLFLDTALILRNQKRLSKELLQSSKNAAERLSKKGLNSELRKKGEDFLEKLIEKSEPAHVKADNGGSTGVTPQDEAAF